MLLCNIINMYTERGGGGLRLTEGVETLTERGGLRLTERARGGGGPDSQRKYRHSERDKLRLEERRGKR